MGKGRQGIPSKEVEDFIQNYVTVRRTPFSDAQIVKRVLYPLVNEGFKCLEEGIARQPSDIDVVYVYGYGWPIYRGGPMYWADHEVGLKKLLTDLRELSLQFPATEYFVPSKLLEKCVALDMTLQSYYESGLHKTDPAISKL